MTEIIEKHVRIVALDSLYSRVPYIFTAMKLRNGKFLTGQESILTAKQMTGEKELTKVNKDELMMGDDPFIINPDNSYTLHHARKFDLSYTNEGKKKVFVNPKDVAEFNFFSVQPEVIKDKKEYQRSKHFFYIEDKEAEAESKVTIEDKIFDAADFIRKNTSISRLKDVALLLTHISPKFNVNVQTLTLTRLQARLYDACRSIPDDVLKCKGHGDDDLNHERLFVLKAITIGQIQLFKGSYYYGINRQEYIADSFDKVLAWVKAPEHSSQVERLGQLVKEYEENQKV